MTTKKEAMSLTQAILKHPVYGNAYMKAMDVVTPTTYRV